MEQQWPVGTMVHWEPKQTWPGNRGRKREGTVIGHDAKTGKVLVQYMAMPELGKRKTIGVPPNRLQKIEQFTP